MVTTASFTKEFKSEAESYAEKKAAVLEIKTYGICPGSI
jgi:hypothetical protein